MRKPLTSSLRICIVLSLTAIVALAPGARAATPEEVDRAIEKAKAYLYSQLKPEGHWENDDKRLTIKHDDWHKMQGDSYGGWTALAVYALLASGENPQDP